MPESYLDETTFHVGDDLQFNLFIGIYAGNTELYSVEGYLSVGIGGSGISEAKNITGRFIRERKFERAKERFPFMKRFFKSHNGYLSGGAVHLNLVVAMNLMPQYFPYLRYVLDILTGAGPHNAILKPPIRPLNLAFGLGGEGICHFYPEVLQYLFPLGVRFIGFYIVLSPYGVSLLNEAEYGMIVHVIGKRKAIPGAQRFQRANVTPARFLFQDIGIEQVSAIVINAGDEVQFVGNIGRPSVIG
jgi:hypothetical protein